MNGAANVDLVASTVKGKECVLSINSDQFAYADPTRSFIFNLVSSTLSVAVLSIDGPGKTSLVGVTDFKDVLAGAGTPIRTSGYLNPSKIIIDAYLVL